MHVCDNWESALVPTFLIRKLQEPELPRFYSPNSFLDSSWLTPFLTHRHSYQDEEPDSNASSTHSLCL